MINLYVIVNLRPSWPALGLFVMTCTMCCCPPIYMEKLYRFTWTNSVCLFIFQNDEVVCDQTAEWASYKRWKCRYRLFVLPSARYFTIIVEKFHFLTPGKSLEKCWGFWGSFCLIGRCGEKLAGNKQREIDHSIWCNGAFRKTSIVPNGDEEIQNVIYFHECRLEIWEIGVRNHWYHLCQNQYRFERTQTGKLWILHFFLLHLCLWFIFLIRADCPRYSKIFNEFRI